MADINKAEVLLRELGLNDHEAATYLALLELEAVSIRKVAARTGINRGTTYDALKQLVKLGLASSRRSGERDYFSVESPEKIYDLIREKRKELWQAHQLSQDVVPALLAQKVRPQGQPLVRYYDDAAGVVAILRDVLRTCSKLPTPEYYVYSSRPLRKYLYRKFPNFTRQRINEGIFVKVIAVGEGGDPTAISERKWLAEPLDNPTSSYTIIYGNKIALISLADDYSPYGVIIEDAGAAALQRVLFEQLWEQI